MGESNASEVVGTEQGKPLVPIRVREDQSVGWFGNGGLGCDEDVHRYK